MSSAIKVVQLKKSYDGKPVLKGLDLEVMQGEIFALLGVNGAGKTTALECIEGLRPYDSGAVAVHGTMGIQLQVSALPDHIRPMEAVALFCRWRRARPDGEMLDALGISALKKQQYRQLSTGQKRRLLLALALIGDPQIIFLDEPTAGLDTVSRRALHEQIGRLKAMGKTIVLASHDMAEVETLCDRIAILKEGRVAFCGTASQLSRFIGQKYVIHLKTCQGEQSLDTDNIENTLFSLMGELKQKGIRVLDLRVDRGSLEQHFMEIAGGKGK